MSNTGYPDWETFMATSFAGRREFPLVAPETPSFMSRPVATTPEDLEGADVVIIGAPYVAAEDGQYAGVAMEEWIEAPKRVRQQSARYRAATSRISTWSSSITSPWSTTVMRPFPRRS